MAATNLRASGASVDRSVPAPWVLVAAVCAPPAIVLAVLLALVGLPLVVAVLVPLVLAAAAAWWLVQTSEAAVLGDVVLVPADEAGHPRLFNMVDGLVDSHGFRRPSLFIIDDDARNALVFGRRADHTSLAVTRGWLDSASLLGLEGLLARELACSNDPALASTTVAISISRVLPGGLADRLLQRVAGEHRVLLDDFGAVRYTRYPPGLAEALAVQRDGSPAVRGAPARSAPLWVAPPVPTRPVLADVAPLDIRVDALREL